jgi:meso-butanediol dehydrogenase/(S,S)-butanediol dehydrogenase/diacetyl reductase
MDGRLVGKVAVVTGASRGLGRSISAAFAAEGARVVMLARSGSELAEAARRIGDMAVPMVCDVTSSNAVSSVFAGIMSQWGGVDVLVNNAALANPQLIEEVDDRVAQLELGANLLGPLYCCRAVIGSMRERGGGDIVNISSESVHNPYPYLAFYAATKAALETMSAGLRVELKGSNVRVAVFRSGRVQGTFSRDWDPEMKRRARAAAEKAGFYAVAGGSVPPEVPAKAILELVLLDRAAHIDLLELRAV